MLNAFLLALWVVVSPDIPKSVSLPVAYARILGAMGYDTARTQLEHFVCFRGKESDGRYKLTTMVRPHQTNGISYTCNGRWGEGTCGTTYWVNHGLCGEGTVMDIHTHPRLDSTPRMFVPSQIDLQAWESVYCEEPDEKEINDVETACYPLHGIMVADQLVIWYKDTSGKWTPLEAEKIGWYE